MNLIEQDLVGLRTLAPSTLVGNVLLDTELAHRDAPVDHEAVGPLFVGGSPDGLTAVARVDLTSDAFEADYQQRTQTPLVRVESLPDRLAHGLDRVFESGKLGSLRVDLGSLTPFQQAVLSKTAQIPPGEIRSYGWVAREIDKPGAVRAVGSALNKNPIPVVLPCHRVGKSDGSIGEYAYGPEMKRALLVHEGLDTVEVDALAQRGVRLTGSDTTGIFCNPTCRHTRRTMTLHTVEFRNEPEAREAGYRPCKVCRPAAA